MKRSNGVVYAAIASLLTGQLAAQQTSVNDPALTPTHSVPRTADDPVESPAVYLRRARDTLIGASDFSAAVNPARQIVAAQEKNPDERYAADLATLAAIQTQLGELEDAEDNYLKAIDLIEMTEGEFALALVEPYESLGRSYIKAARYPEAITALEQAQHISQRNLGLFNVEQAAVLDDITTAYLGLGDTKEARRLQLERVANAVKRFGKDDPRVIPFRYELASYYQRSRLQGSAREQYAEVLKSQETQLGAEHPGLLTPLRQLAKVDLLITQGEEDVAYTRLMKILEQSPQADPIERGLSLAVAGDWASVRGDIPTAHGYYQQAWEAFRAKPDVDPQAYFAAPVMIDFIAPLSSVDRGTRTRPYAWATIVFEFDLSADGRVSNVKTVGSQAPPGPLESRYSRRLREAHFRPRLVGGVPVATSHVQFTHYFRYYVNPDDQEEEG